MEEIDLMKMYATAKPKMTASDKRKETSRMNAQKAREAKLAKSILKKSENEEGSSDIGE